MDERQWWATCDSPQSMLSHLLESKASGRKLRLFACAALRFSWGLREHDDPVRWLTAFELAERFADGEAVASKLAEALTEIRAKRQQVSFIRLEARLDAAVAALDPGADPAWAAEEALEAGVYLDSHDPVRGYELSNWRSKAEEKRCALLREVFLPFASPVITPAWLAWNSGVIPRLAGALYDDGGEFSSKDLDLLADALEEAGCDDERILYHRWSSSYHVRGCWLVDLILGKE
jgi:hypothetical protein